MYVIYHRQSNKIVQVDKDLRTCFKRFKPLNQPITVSSLKFLLGLMLSTIQVKTLYENHTGCQWFGGNDGADLFNACYNLFLNNYPEVPFMRKLIFDVNSQCLFTVYSDEMLRGALSAGDNHDVTDLPQFELRYLEQERAIALCRLTLRHNLHEHLVSRMQVPSCINCLHWREADEVCTLYNSRPPANVIVTSCGQGWEPEIPF